MKECPKCKSELEFVSGDFPTGVRAPDGYRERHYEEGYYCGKCRQTFDPEDVEEGFTCPWCMKENQSTEHIRECSGWKPSGMPPNETGHEYGTCGCGDCRAEYQRIK